MAEDHFEGDTLGKTIPYLDAVSRARLPEVSRGTRDTDHEVCRPSADVYRAHRVNGRCPPYATTVDANTDCCETRFNTVNASDMEFLTALKHGYVHHNQIPGSPTLRTALRQVVPEIYKWFENGQAGAANIQVGANTTLVLNMTREWFPLLLKFYMVLRPSFIVQAHDPVLNRTSNVLRHDRVTLGTMISVALRNIIKDCVRAVGAEVVEDFVGSAGPFVPCAMRCRTYNYHSGQVRGYVDISDVASIVSDPLCGFGGEHHMLLGAVAVVRQTHSWVNTLSDILVQVYGRIGLRMFWLRVYTRLIQGNQGQYMGDTNLLPDTSGPIADAQRYRPVVDHFVARLPGQWTVAENVPNGGPQTWQVRWTVSNASHPYDYKLYISKNGKLSMIKTAAVVAANV